MMNTPCSFFVGEHCLGTPCNTCEVGLTVNLRVLIQLLLARNDASQASFVF